LPLVVLTTHSFSQEMKEQILSFINIDTAQIRNEGMRSLHVYSEMKENNYDNSGNYLRVKKRGEIEFNQLGLKVYERKIPLTTRSHALGDDGTLHRTFTYDENHRIASSCSKGKWNTGCQFYTYDEDNHILSVKNEGSSLTNGMLTFRWKKDKMVEAKNSFLEESDYFFERSFDVQGRVTEMRQGNGHITTYDYKDNGNETRMVVTSSFQDSMTSKYILSSRKDTEQFTYFLKLNNNLDTLSETIATYSNNNDLISLRYFDNSEHLRSKSGYGEPAPMQVEGSTEYIPMIEPPRTTQYDIANEYENGLLIKRKIQITEDNGYRESTRIEVERFVYEKTVLSHRSWPSNEEEEYYRDSIEEAPVFTPQEE
jgi:YD repeat-containing protein